MHRNKACNASSIESIAVYYLHNFACPFSSGIFIAKKNKVNSSPRAVL
jgi:hypothetical protein